MMWTGEGFTEGFTWSSDAQRKSNRWIRGDWAKDANGMLGYHGWRWIEDIGKFGAILVFLPVNYWLFFAGVTFVGWFIYQRAMGISRKNEWFPAKSPYKIFGREIPHRPFLDWTVLAVGIILCLA